MLRVIRVAVALALVAVLAACQFGGGSARITDDAGNCHVVTQPAFTVPTDNAVPTTLPGAVVAPCDPTTSSPTTSPAASSTTTTSSATTTTAPAATTKPPTSTSAPSTTTTTKPPAAGARPYFAAADWLWGAIPADPKLDPQSASWVADLGKGKHVADTIEYGVVLRGPDGITATTPRYRIPFSARWCCNGDPFHGDTMPIPASVTSLPGGGDSHVSVADPSTGYVYSLFGANRSGSGWRAIFGARVPLQGDGRETDGGTSTGSNISRFAGVVRASEIQAGVIPHALFFSSDMVKPKDFRYPAAKTDGSNMAGVSNPIPEGARVQLDPTIDLAKIPGITKAELTVGRALQQYGAYVGDNGGARAAFLFEYLGPKAADQKPYADAGMGSGDYYGFPHLPWNRLRVLASSTGR